MIEERASLMTRIIVGLSKKCISWRSKNTKGESIDV